MGSCVFCGRKMKVFESINWEISNDSERGVCADCHEIFTDKISRRLEQAETIEAFEQEAKQLIEEYQLQCSREGMKYLIDYLNDKEEQLYNKITKLALEKVDEQKSSTVFSFLQSHMMTSGYNFEGYLITKYLTIVSGESVVGTGIFSELAASGSILGGVESNEFSDAMRTAKNAALIKMIRQSVQAGGNAVIGVSFSYINLVGSMVGVSANGTSVVIQKVD